MSDGWRGGVEVENTGTGMGGKLWIGSCRNMAVCTCDWLIVPALPKHGEMWLIAIGKKRHHGPCGVLALAISGIRDEVEARAQAASHINASRGELVSSKPGTHPEGLGEEEYICTKSKPMFTKLRPRCRAFGSGQLIDFPAT
jgi:hypothetical protein